MPYSLPALYDDVAQIQHGTLDLFGSGRLIGKNLVLTARHVVRPESAEVRMTSGWNVRMKSGRTENANEKWAWINAKVVWMGAGSVDLALLELSPQDESSDRVPRLRLAIAQFEEGAQHRVRCPGYSSAYLFLLAILSVGCYAASPEEQAPRLYVESGVNHSARSVAWSMDGRFIAGSGIDRTIRVWSVSPARELLAIENEADIVSLVFISNDHALLTLDADGFVKEWDLFDQRLLGSQRCSDTRSSTSLAYSKDHSSVLCADSKTDSIREWNMTLTKEYPSHTIRTKSPLDKLTFSDGGRLLTGLDQAGILHILDAETDNELNTSSAPLNLDTVAVASKADLLAAINSTVGGHIEIWSGLSKKNGIAPERSLNINNPHAIAFSFDERTLAYASEDGD